MNRKFIALVILFALLLSGCSLIYDQELKDEISEIIDNSDVQLVTESYHHLQEVNIAYENGDTRQMVYSYPEASNQFLKDYIGCIIIENGQEVQREEYTRDGKDNIIAVNSGASTKAFELTYDENNRIIKKVVFVDGVEEGYEHYLYNAQGLITEIKEFDIQELVCRTVIEYDDNGRRTKVTRYDGTGNIIDYVLCEFDQKTYKEKVSQFDSNEALLRYTLNSYDLHGLIVVEEAYDANGNLISTTTRRYESGEITYDAAKGFPGHT